MSPFTLLFLALQEGANDTKSNQRAIEFVELEGKQIINLSLPKSAVITRYAWRVVGGWHGCRAANLGSIGAGWRSLWRNNNIVSLATTSLRHIKATAAAEAEAAGAYSAEDVNSEDGELG